MYLFIYFFDYLFYLFIYLFIYLFYLFIYLFIYLLFNEVISYENDKEYPSHYTITKQHILKSSKDAYVFVIIYYVIHTLFPLFHTFSHFFYFS